MSNALQNSLAWTFSRVGGLLFLVGAVWLIGYAIMGYGFATFLALGVGIGASLLLWVELVKRRRLKMALPNIVYQVAGWGWIAASVVGTFAAFALNGFETGTTPKQSATASATNQPAPTPAPSPKTLVGGGLAPIPLPPDLPVRQFNPAPDAGVEKPKAVEPIKPKVEYVPDIPKAILDLKSAEVPKKLAGLAVLKRAERDNHAEEISALLEPLLLDKGSLQIQALYTAKIWGTKANRDTLRKLAEGKASTVTRLAKEALDALEAREK